VTVVVVGIERLAQEGPQAKRHPHRLRNMEYPRRGPVEARTQRERRVNRDGRGRLEGAGTKNQLEYQEGMQYRAIEEHSAPRYSVVIMRLEPQLNRYSTPRARLLVGGLRGCHRAGAGSASAGSELRRLFDMAPDGMLVLLHG
jgi:hypothetical protein